LIAGTAEGVLLAPRRTAMRFRAHSYSLGAGARRAKLGTSVREWVDAKSFAARAVATLCREVRVSS
jgi:hypothetical protein